MNALLQRCVMVAALSLALTAERGECSKVVHVFVALADNAHQGIVPVPAKIGDGDKPDDNLYWGCDEGVRAWFSSSRLWKKVGKATAGSAAILERLVFKHADKDVFLVADAWRGSEIKACTLAFAAAAAGQGSESVVLKDRALKAGGAADLVAYIGHNGLMDFSIDWPPAAPAASSGRPAIVLCCISSDYFGPPLEAAGAAPILLTTQLMYPGAFILHDGLEAWLAEKDSSAVREAAARAYAKNQKLSLKAALGVFADPLKSQK